MRNNAILILGLLLAACKSGPEKAPEFEIRTEVVEKLVPVPVPCDRTVTRPKDPMNDEAPTPEGKVDRANASDAAFRTYSLLLEAAFITCGGKVLP